MFVIGLTGGIGSGKSTVTEMLRAKGAAVVHADLVGHEVYRPDTHVWDEVVAAFGRQVLAPDSQIDRRKLGSIVFADHEALDRLNAITHPPMRRLMAERLDELRRQGERVAVLEAALLIEAGWIDLVDEVWLMLPAVAAQRLIERSGSVGRRQRRIACQLSNDERLDTPTCDRHRLLSGRGGPSRRRALGWPNGPPGGQDGVRKVIWQLRWDTRTSGNTQSRNTSSRRSLSTSL
jgi:dephospho-CoA kinase